MTRGQGSLGTMPGPTTREPAGPAETADGAGQLHPAPYLYAEDLARFTPFTVDAIARMVARGTLKLGVHCYQPHGRRGRVIFKWAAIVSFIESARPAANDVVERRCGKGPLDVEEATKRLHRMLR